MSVFILKLIALATMLIDHIGEFFPGATPMAFRWIGRISAPIFFFCMIQGLIHTSNRKKYLIRLYLGSLIMGIGNLILHQLFPDAPVMISNNIFTTLFLVALIVTLFEAKISIGKKAAAFVAFIAVQLVSIIAGSALLALMANGDMTDPAILADAMTRWMRTQGIVAAVLPNLLFCEGAYMWVLLGLLMYIFRKNKKSFAIMYILYCLVELIPAYQYNFSPQYLFYLNPQWLMILSLPFILLYNGQKGKGMKYLFYLFYPLHIWGLYILSNFIGL